MGHEMDEDLAHRLQEEQKALNALSQVLKEHIAVTPTADSGQWLEGLRLAFDRLHAHIARCIEMKVKDGYLETILKERPTLTHQVAAIKAEHGQLLRMADAIRNDLAAARADDRLLVADSCARVLRFIAIVGQHEQRENMIVLFAFNQDLGAH